MQHVDRNIDGVEIKTDVDVMTDADCITMDDGDLRSGVKKMIDDRIGEVIDGAPEQLDTLKEIAQELEKNQSGVSTILNKMNSKLEAKDLTGYAKTADVDNKIDKVKGAFDTKIHDLGSEINDANMDIGELKDVIGELARKKVDKKDMVDLKRCIVLTQSEYNSLPSSKKNREDTLYFIKA